VSTSDIFEAAWVWGVGVPVVCWLGSVCHCHNVVQQAAYRFSSVSEVKSSAVGADWMFRRRSKSRIRDVTWDYSIFPSAASAQLYHRVHLCHFISSLAAVLLL